ncbi:MAG: TonB-dependent receptor [Phenylobacterium sp.]|uniref:TonB-dependent receptor n=1 Tax=Phenylobacterium sp. TaxID=1871053 RepID=UPI0025E33732|nr:TonB-dependent receptor [Phenylobacterium sp.]MBI1198881.1 TonB-dependent receptor [Phenylobacterium sp.]
MLSRKSILLSCACAAAAVSGAAHAQQSSGSVSTIAELVVTAEKREQSLQDVPVAISAFTSENRDLLGINTIQDMTNFTPGLQYSSQLDRISLRGVGRLSNVQAADPGVATYSDGVYTSSTVEAGKTPIFTDRVEILRGPQGTLYGRNSIGGAINVISKRPTHDFYAEVRGSYSNYDHSTIEGAVSGPITEGLRFRLGANWDKQRKGYYDNVVPGMPSEGGVIDTKYVEFQLDMNFGEHLDGWFKVALSKWDNGSGGPGARATWRRGDYNSMNEFGTLNLTGDYAYSGRVTGVDAFGVTSNPSADNARKIAADTAQTVKLDRTIIFATQWAWHGEGWDLRYIGGGTTYRYTLTSDLDGTAVHSYTIPVPPVFISAGATPCVVVPGCQPLTVYPNYISVYREDKHWFSHELNLASTDDGPFQWLAGAYYYHESYKQPVYTYLPDQVQLETPVGGPLNPNRRVFDNRPQLADRSYAAFGQIDWEFAQNWKTTIGLRYSHDHKYGDESARIVCFAIAACLGGALPEGLGSFTPAVDITGALVAPGTPEGTTGPATKDALGFYTRHYDASWDAWTGTAGLQWEPDSNTMLYGRYSRGYKAGGFRVGIDTTLGAFPYTDAEHGDNFEVGIKKNWSRLQTNVALFLLEYKNLQAPLTVANTSGALAVSESRFVNVPKAENYGLEFEGIWSPIDNLRITATYSYLHTEIKRLSGIVDPDDPTALNQSATPLTNLTPCVSGQALCDVFTGMLQRPQDLKGNRLPNSPRHKVALNGLYTWDFDMGSLSASATYIWRDTQYGSLFSRGYNKSPAWDQVDLRLTWKDIDNKYTIIGYVKNVFDTIGYDGGASATRRAYSRSGFLPVALTDVNGVSGLVSTYPITPPRTYGVEFQYRF